MTSVLALGQCLVQASARLCTMLAFVAKRSSRVIPGLRGTPATEGEPGCSGEGRTCHKWRALGMWGSAVIHTANDRDGQSCSNVGSWRCQGGKGARRTHKHMQRARQSCGVAGLAWQAHWERSGSAWAVHSQRMGSAFGATSAAHEHCSCSGWAAHWQYTPAWLGYLPPDAPGSQAFLVSASHVRCFWRCTAHSPGRRLLHRPAFCACLPPPPPPQLPRQPRANKCPVLALKTPKKLTVHGQCIGGTWALHWQCTGSASAAVGAALAGGELAVQCQ